MPSRDPPRDTLSGAATLSGSVRVALVASASVPAWRCGFAAGQAVSGTERIHATPGGIRLGPLDLIEPGSARNFVIQLRAGRFHGFVVRRGDAVHGFVDQCPHMGLPLARTLDDYLDPSGAFIACGWHGALFDAATGFCVSGPCRGAGLTPWPVCVVEGAIVTVGPDQAIWGVASTAARGQ
jgi:nitrite reductase/ring-hydroxylating ferredoxin subunit